MTMRRYMAIHTFHSEKTKEEMFNWAAENLATQKEYMASVTHEKCRCVATWLGNEDFFFCHWLAETDQDIHNALKEDGTDQLVFTACYEVPIYIDANCLTDERAFPMNALVEA